MPPLSVTIDGRAYVVAWPDGAGSGVTAAATELARRVAAGDTSDLELVSGMALTVNWANVATVEVGMAPPEAFVREVFRSLGYPPPTSPKDGRRTAGKYSSRLDRRRP